jgi:hypothetical protein
MTRFTVFTMPAKEPGNAPTAFVVDCDTEGCIPLNARVYAECANATDTTLAWLAEAVEAMNNREAR